MNSCEQAVVASFGKKLAALTTRRSKRSTAESGLRGVAPPVVQAAAALADLPQYHIENGNFNEALELLAQGTDWGRRADIDKKLIFCFFLQRMQALEFHARRRADGSADGEPPLKAPRRGGRSDGGQRLQAPAPPTPAFLFPRR